MSKVQAALLQLRTGISRKESLQNTSRLIRKAADQGARLVATPENTGFMQKDPDKGQKLLRTEENEPLILAYSALAAELGIFLLIGSISIKVSPSHAANRSFLFGPDGTGIATYDKIHLFDVQVSKTESWRESDQIKGGSKAVMASIMGMKCGFSICYDLRFAALFRTLAKAGAGLFFVPAAFTRPTGRAHWQTLLRARAIENHAYVLAPAQGGTHEDGRKTWGHSMVIDPWGKIIASLPHDKPGILMAELDTKAPDLARARLPVLEQEQVFEGP